MFCCFFYPIGRYLFLVRCFHPLKSCKRQNIILSRASLEISLKQLHFKWLVMSFYVSNCSLKCASFPVHLRFFVSFSKTNVFYKRHPTKVAFLLWRPAAWDTTQTCSQIKLWNKAKLLLRVNQSRVCEFTIVRVTHVLSMSHASQTNKCGWIPTKVRFAM